MKRNLRGILRLLASIIVVAFLAGLNGGFGVKGIDNAWARISSCGEPARSVDTLGRTVDFDQCYRHVFNYSGTEKKVIVYYTLTNGIVSDRLPDVDTDPNDGINDIAAQTAQWTEEAWRRYRDSGFGDPQGRNDIDVYLFDHPELAGWCCGSRHYEFDAPLAVNVLAPGNDPRDGMSIAFHELWHATEYSRKGGWIDEGTATNMSDHVNLPVDVDDTNSYIGQVRTYLGSNARKSLTVWDNAYSAALWWTYYMERIGHVTSEPDRGVDAMLQFWHNLGTHGLPTLDSIIRDATGTLTLQDVWIDFTVANYVKEFTATSYPEKYQYRDELQAGAPDYPSVRLDLDRTVDVGDGIIATTDIDPWAAQYYQVHPDSAVPFVNIEFRQDTNHRLSYTLLLIKGNDLIQEEHQIGRDFVRSVFNDNYDRVVIIVTALSEFANFRYSINGSQPVLNIVDPLQGRPAQAGDPSSPDKILVKVEVLSPVGGGTPVVGIDPNDFVITIGSEVVQSDQRVSSAYIQGQYWMLIRAPTQSASGNYNLYVELNPTTSDIETGAVIYAARTDADNVLVMDRSGSMNEFGKIFDAKNAARLYVDSWRVGDKIGVVSYNEDATVDLSLRDWNDTNRNDAFASIKDLEAGGATSVGDGLLDGMDELINRGEGTHEWALILLSDGLENRPASIQDFLDDYNTRKDDRLQVPRVHAVALGPDADRARLEQVASKTGGTYHYAAEPDLTTTLLPLADSSNDLAEIYRVVGETVAKQQQIYLASDIIPFRNPVSHIIPVDGGASEAIFVINGDATLMAEINLFRPDNTLVVPSLIDQTHIVWRIPTPLSGEWRMTVNREMSCEFCARDYLVEAALKSDLTLNVFLGLDVDDRIIGRPMPILVSLADNQSILGATVNVQITDPAGVVRSLNLFDDGLHNDGQTNDGFYGNTFYRTYLQGSYVAVVTAKGTSEVAGDFQRRVRTSFNMDSAPDGDKDGIPDYADPDPGRSNANEDPDQDGLINIDEFRQGTDPRNSDTDNGGESDGSELAGGGDPLEPADDQIPCILDFQATNVLRDREDYVNPQGSVLQFSVDPAHDHFILWRAAGLTGPWKIINNQVEPTGSFIDHQVTLGKTYYYRLQAVGQKGHKSCILGPRSTTPKVDSLPPEGFILINGGAIATSSLDVLLTLEASTDTVEVIISNSPDFNDASWEQYQTSRPWQLKPQNNLATVYAKYRDAADNESEVLNDSIQFKSEGAPNHQIYLPLILK